MKVIRPVLLGIALSVTVACSQGEGSQMSASQSAGSEVQILTDPETEVFADKVTGTDDETFDQGSGPSGCDLMGVKLATWAQESGATAATEKVIGVLDQIQPLVAKPRDRTERNLRKVTSIIMKDLVRAVNSLPNSTMDQIPDDDVRACADLDLKLVYDVATKSLPLYIDSEVVSRPFLGVTYAGEMLEQASDFGLLRDKKVRLSHGEIVDDAVSRARSSLQALISEFSAYEVSAE